MATVTLCTTHHEKWGWVALTMDFANLADGAVDAESKIKEAFRVPLSSESLVPQKVIMLESSFRQSTANSLHWMRLMVRNLALFRR